MVRRPFFPPLETALPAFSTSDGTDFQAILLRFGNAEADTILCQALNGVGGPVIPQERTSNRFAGDTVGGCRSTSMSRTQALATPAAKDKINPGTSQ